MPRSLLIALLSLVGLALPGFTQNEDFFVDIGRGPVLVNVPPSYSPAVPAPLIVLLHGYSFTGEFQEEYFGLTPLSDAEGFLYAYPDGELDDIGLNYWNATDACCGVGGDADDSSYLKQLIDEIKGVVSVDPNRVHFVGHSNGGFMSYRMACDHSEDVASIASLAGATWLQAEDCDPTSPVHVLQAHGTSDATVLFDGGCFGFFTQCYPGAIDTVKQWAQVGHCDLTVDTSSENLDLALLQPGAETSVFKVESGCAPNGSAELWSIGGAGHVPLFTANWSTEVVNWLLAHPKQ